MAVLGGPPVVGRDLHMPDPAGGQTDGSGQVVLLHVHVKGVELDLDRGMIDRVDELQAVGHGVEHEALEAVQNLEADVDPEHGGVAGDLVKGGSGALPVAVVIPPRESHPGGVGHSSEYRAAELGGIVQAASQVLHSRGPDLGIRARYVHTRVEAGAAQHVQPERRGGASDAVDSHVQPGHEGDLDPFVAGLGCLGEHRRLVVGPAVQPVEDLDSDWSGHPTASSTANANRSNGWAGTPSTNLTMTTVPFSGMSDPSTLCVMPPSTPSRRIEASM